MKKATPSLLLTFVASAMTLPVFASQHDPIREMQMRALFAAESSAPAVTTAGATTTPVDTTSAQPTATTPAATSASPTTAATSAAATSEATASATHETSASPSTTQVAATSVVPTTATDSQGQVIVTYVTPTPTASSATPSSTNTSSGDSGGGLSTGSIVGLSVSGGIAALGIILFFVWKFTRKRFSDFEGDEAIKWPDLNAHNTDVHALPTNSTGRAGFGPENDSEVNLARAPSPGGAYANSIAASSVREMYGSGDPYAVPPLPHLNPNQPYHDEPSAYGQPGGTYYDPYRGPVPNTFTDTVADHGAEAIPMTQMARGRSPAPQVAYDMQGRGSPAPQAAMGYAGMDERSRTPNPALVAGRASPSPQAAYGYGPR